MYDKWLRRSIALLVLTLFVAACGGGSSGAGQASDFTLEIAGQGRDKSVEGGDISVRYNDASSEYVIRLDEAGCSSDCVFLTLWVPFSIQAGTMQMNIDATTALVAFGSAADYRNFGVNSGTLTIDSVSSTISGSFDLVASSFDDQFATFTAIGIFQDIELPTE